jgi:DNA-binding transcriptional regulator LsrR (DeoR family)
VARHLAELLCEPAEALPTKIVLHALVSGFDLFDPTTDPNAFFTYFVGDQGLLVETAFVGLHAPPVIGPEQLHSFMNLEPIKLARQHAERLDMVVTSASQVKDEHNALRQHMHISEEVLRKASCIGDILWQPIGPNGPVQVPSGVRALTLIDLQELQALVARGGHVLLVAGPCGACREPKAEVIEAILRQPRPLITHLVTDSRCAGALISRGN